MILAELLARDGTSHGHVSVEELSMDGYNPKTARMLLQHVHLPRLDEADVISWDPDEQTIAHGPAFADLKPLLEATAPLLSEFRESDDTESN